MNIEINLFAFLARYKPKNTGKGSWIVNCKEGTSVADLLLQLKVPLKEVQLIFLNGVHVTRETVLKEGDRVGIFPPVGGG